MNNIPRDSFRNNYWIRNREILEEVSYANISRTYIHTNKIKNQHLFFYCMTVLYSWFAID
jgi:hypothetical protein